VRNSRYEFLPSFVLGFHGTDEATAERVLAGKAHLAPSKNAYDWLGSGIYFWEHSPQRALEFAQQAMQTPKISKGAVSKPAVIGAIIDPGLCFNLLEASALEQLSDAYRALRVSPIGSVTPPNSGGVDKPLRYLDCAVMELMHSLRSTDTESALPPYDTVRGAFWEGEELYPSAGFKQRNHVQMVVRNAACIKGYFRVIE
jgi:hypothetical protein